MLLQRVYIFTDVIGALAGVIPFGAATTDSQHSMKESCSQAISQGQLFDAGDPRSTFITTLNEPRDCLKAHVSDIVIFGRPRRHRSVQDDRSSGEIRRIDM